MSFRGYREGRTASQSVELPARDRGSGARSVSMARAVVALRGALAPSICPVPWYSDGRERAFAGRGRSRFSGAS